MPHTASSGPTDAPPPQTGRAPTELNRLTAYRAIRARYFRVGAGIGVIINGAALSDVGAGLAVECARAVITLTCLVAFVRAQRGEAHRRDREVALAILFAGAIAITALRLPGGWPINALYGPLLVAFAALVASARFATWGMAAMMLGVLGAIGLRAPTLSADLITNATNWVMALVLMLLFVRRFATTLLSGAHSLIESSEIVTAARRDIDVLTASLSLRVADTVNALTVALQRDYASTLRAATEVSIALRASRRAVPAEPTFPESQLVTQLESLRGRIMDWTIGASVALFLMQTIRLQLIVGAGTSNARISLALALVAATIRWWWPQSRRPVYIALMVILYAITMPQLLGWSSTQPNLWPGLAITMLSAVLLSVTLGMWVGLLALSAICATTLVALRVGPTMKVLGTVNLSVAYATLIWLVTKIPIDLVGALEAQRDVAALAIRDRRRLVATVFHDLANPHASLMLLLDEAADGRPFSEFQAEALGLVTRMQGTLRAALASAPAEQEVSVPVILDELVLGFRHHLTAKAIRVAVTSRGDARVRCDEALLRDSVLANLLSNAIKFSPPNGDLALEIVRADQMVGIAVADNGSGLPSTVRAALSARTAVPSTAGTQGEGGTGYGLTLANEYLTSMGGKLELRDRPGGGLWACAWLPSSTLTATT